VNAAGDLISGPPSWKAEPLADVITATNRIVISKRMNHETLGRPWIEAHRERAISLGMTGTWRTDLSAGDFATERLRDGAKITRTHAPGSSSPSFWRSQAVGTRFRRPSRIVLISPRAAAA